MDNLTYQYSKDVNGFITSNKLRYVNDQVAGTNYTTEDIDNQGTNNYLYDQIGNLTKDVEEGVDSIYWTVYGKIKSITKSDGTTISYVYDGAGNRVQKTVTNASSVTTSTMYVRDAQGNVLSVYESAGSTSNSLILKEQHIYGSSRLGLINADINVENPSSLPPSFVRGKKTYELSNHLGNVLAVITDRKIPVASGSTVSYYLPDIKTATDYYAGGMIMPGRSFQSSSYKYGFNGQEMDNEVKGTGNSVHFTFREYDPRIGRFFAIDPLTKKYPQWSPYQFAGGQVISSRELEGAEPATDVNVQAKAGFTVSFDYKKMQSHVRGFASVGASARIGGVQVDASIGLSMTNGGVGSNQGTTGNTQLVSEFNLSGGLTVGAGNASPMSINTFHNQSGNFVNTGYAASLSVGLTQTFSSLSNIQPDRNQTNGYVYARAGGVSFGTYNDFLVAPLGLKNNDSYWTGGGEAQINTKAGMFTASYHGFTGVRPTDFLREFSKGPDGQNYYTQTPSEKLYNNGQTTLSFATSGMLFGVSHIGHGSINGQWFQNMIHSKMWHKDPETGTKHHIPWFANISTETFLINAGTSND